MPLRFLIIVPRVLGPLYGGLKNLSSGFYYNWGMTYARWGQPAKAMWYLNRAAKLNAGNAQIFYQRGLLFIAMGQTREAISDFSAAINSNTHYMEAYLNRSLLYTLQGRHEEASRDVDSAVALGANRPRAENQIAELRNDSA
ncbi:MAG: hypothetical protein O3A93_14070 [Chloroflexi bacterium]|nr:hypothetical protein [Chloroflexota bacterium]MDA1272354.1 hypothetical protein [Chloroflexota bacterium]PKB58439.1 MAG: hypothetical protein BZY83_07065 [SAR202 cluster bacterium Casp-Chloro-G2]